MLEYLEEVLEQTAKVIIFAHHHFFMDAIQEKLDALKIGYMRIDGSTRQDQRGELVKKFQGNASTRAAILSIMACKEGLTLTAAHTVVFAELSWVTGYMEQAEDRA